MKKLKVILSSILLLVVALAPSFVLAGCAKHYTVTISIAAGQGKVSSKYYSYGNNSSLVGENDIEEGKNLEYVVIPSEHYEIDYIKIDGVARSFTVDADGLSGQMIENIQKHYNIEVGFKVKTYKVTYEYWDSTENAYVKYAPGGTIFETPIKYGENATIEGISTFGFTTLFVGTGTYVDYPTSDTFTVGSDIVLRAPGGKGYAELHTLLGE